MVFGFGNNNELVLACAHGDLKEVKECFRKGADIHFRQDDPLHTACKNGHLKIVKYLLKKGADIHAFRDHALKMACQFGHYDIVKFLVEKGARVDNVIIEFANGHGKKSIAAYLEAELKNKQAKAAESDDNESEDNESDDSLSLVWACQRGNLKKVKKCLRKGADIHFMQDDPLHTACKNGHLEVVKYLVRKGADVNAYGGDTLKTACRFDHYDIIKFLVDEGAIINDTIIEFAKSLGKHTIALYFETQLEKKQPKAAENDDSESRDLDSCNNSLMFAAISGDLDGVKEYLGRGADIHYNADDPLRTACKNGHLEVVKYLVRKGADVNAYGGHPLKMACDFGHYDIAKLLVDKGANVDLVNINFAKRLGRNAIAEYLETEWKKRRAEAAESDDSESGDSDPECDEGQESLNEIFVNACRRGDIKEVKKWYDKGADIDCYAGDPLHEACQNDHLEVVKFLVHNGADMHICNDYAISKAVQYGYLSIVKFLVANGAKIDGLLESFAGANIYVSEDIVSFLRQKIKEDVPEKNQCKRSSRTSAEFTFGEIHTAMIICTDEDNPEGNKRKKVCLTLRNKENNEVRSVDIDF